MVGGEPFHPLTFPEASHCSRKRAIDCSEAFKAFFKLAFVGWAARGKFSARPTRSGAAWRSQRRRVLWMCANCAATVRVRAE